MTRCLTVALSACVAAAATAGSARADRIDAKLNEHAPVVLDALRKQGVKNVGVLRFRVERGKRPESFSAGPINDGLAARLENALVIHADRASPVGVIRDPNHVAAINKVGAWYTHPADRAKLFAAAYPLAWGTAKVKADAFLTGEVRCSGDMLKTTVVIEMFTAADPTKVVKIDEFTIETDRLVLADLGHRFNVAKRGGALRRGIDGDRFAIGEARRRDGESSSSDDGGGTPPGGSTGPDTGNLDLPAPPSLGDIGGVAFQLLSGDEPVAVRPSASASAKWEVTSPAAGSVVVIALKNNSPQKLGVVLKLNEMSTIFQETQDSATCRKWVLAPNQEIKVKGFYQEGGKYAPFKVLVGDEARDYVAQNELGDKAGRIRVEVFAEAPADGGEAGVPRSVSLPRRLPETAKSEAARRDLSSLQDALMKTAKLSRQVKTVTVGGKALKREIIVPDAAGAVDGGAVKEVDFKAAPEPVAAELIQIVKP